MKRIEYADYAKGNINNNEATKSKQQAKIKQTIITKKPQFSYQSSHNFKSYKYSDLKIQNVYGQKEYKPITSITPNNYTKTKFDFQLQHKESIKRTQNRDKSKGIQINSPKQNGPQNIAKNKENDQKNKNISQKRDYSLNARSESKLTNNFIPFNADDNKSINKKYDKQEAFQTEVNQYKNLHQKLNHLQTKILKMKNNLEKKRQDKKNFLELQQKQRRQLEEERIKIEKQSRKQIDRKSYDNAKRKVQTKPQLKSQTKSKQLALKQLVTQVPQHKQYKYFDFNPYSPKHNTYYVSQIVRAYKQQKSLARQHLLYSMQLLKIMENVKRGSAYQIANKNVNLQQKPMHKDKKTIVFDLDQTLIHCNQSLQIPYDIKIPIKFPTGQTIEAGINIRPYAFQILKNLSVNFEIIIFTASHSCYANVVLDHLDPQNKYIQHRLYREHCYATAEGMYVKDLRVINRNLADIVLVDNAAYSYGFQIENGIPIIPYYEGKKDFELKMLEKYIQSLLLVKDVRDSNKKTFKLDKYKQFDDPESLVRQLYLNQ